MTGAYEGCYNCHVQRRIKCDLTRPSCLKCLRKGLRCPGYGVRYRFRKGSASRGKLANCPLMVALTVGRSNESNRCRHSALVWPDGSVTRRDSSVEIGSTPEDSHYQAQDAADSSARLGVEGTINHAPTGQLAITSLFRRPPMSSIARTLQTHNSTNLEMFAHFSDAIAPTMVVFDGRFNGYRQLLLPFAAQDEYVSSAIRVTAMYHLVAEKPELKSCADRLHHQIIRRLREKVDATVNEDVEEVLDMSTWATVIILLTGETIYGGTNLPHLMKMLHYLSDVNMKNGPISVMHAFLKEQTRMMTFTAQPLLGAGSEFISCPIAPDHHFDFINTAAALNPDHEDYINRFRDAYHQAYQITMIRASQNPPPASTTARVEKLRKLCMQIDQVEPGHHALVWVYFIAAAESSTNQLRIFFVDHLYMVHRKTKFRNILIAVEALPKLWELQGGSVPWTEVLPRIMAAFII